MELIRLEDKIVSIGLVQHKSGRMSTWVTSGELQYSLLNTKRLFYCPVRELFSKQVLNKPHYIFERWLLNFGEKDYMQGLK